MSDALSGLRPGIRHVQTLVVDETMVVPAVSTAFTGFMDMPPVFATAYLIGFVEWACIEAVRPSLSPSQRSVGTAISMTHTAPTPIGMRVTAQVELLAVDGTRLDFRVDCRDEIDRIGSGTHGRSIIDLARFSARLEVKRAGQIG